MYTLLLNGDFFIYLVERECIEKLVHMTMSFLGDELVHEGVYTHLTLAHHMNLHLPSNSRV